MSHCIEYSVYKKMMSEKQAKRHQLKRESENSLPVDYIETERKEKRFAKAMQIQNTSQEIQHQDRGKSPRRNLFDQNRELKLSHAKQNQEISRLNSEINRYETTLVCIIDAIKRVYSEEVAEELKKIISDIENANLSQTENLESLEGDLGNSIYQALMHHSNNQSFETDPITTERQVDREECSQNASLFFDDESQCDNKNPRKSLLKDLKPFSKKLHVCGDSGQAQLVSRYVDDQPSRGSLSASRIKSSSKERSAPTHSKHQRKLSCNMTSQLTFNKEENCSESTDRSQQVQSTPSKPQDTVIATNLICENCQRVWTPNAFVAHVHECQIAEIRGQSLYQQQGSSVKLSSDRSMETESAINTMQDTQDARLRRESQNFLKMMNNLASIKDEIECQINLLKFSKQKIDRDAERRKLEKDLAKVNRVIENKRQELGSCQTNGSSSLNSDLSNNQKNKPPKKARKGARKAPRSIRD